MSSQVLCALLVCAQSIILPSVSAAVTTRQVLVDISNVSFEMSDNFLSITFDIGALPESLTPADFWTSEYNQGLARELAPAYLRIGGTWADLTAYDFNGTGPVPTNDFGRKPHVLDRDGFDRLVAFAQAANLGLIFDANLGTYRTHGLGGVSWDPTAFKELLAYAKAKNYKLAGWELGNEPALLKKVIGRHYNVTEFAADFRSFRSVLADGGQGQAKVIGPDASHIDMIHPHTYGLFGPFLNEFISTEHGDGPDVATWHFYYSSGNTGSPQQASWNDFVNASILDEFLDQANAASHQSQPWELAKVGRERWVGETSSFGHSGCSGRAGLCSSFVAGFMWLDKLALAANTGNKIVCRQTFARQEYSLIGRDGLPNPDYYSAVLWKRLIGTQVLKVVDGLAKKRTVRSYAFCAASTATVESAPGAVTLVVLNLEAESVELDFAALGDAGKHYTQDVYILESSKPNNGTQPTSRTMLLNGEDVFAVDSQTGALKSTLVPKRLPADGSAVTLPAYSYGFVVLVDINVHACSSNPVLV